MLCEQESLGQSGRASLRCWHLSRDLHEGLEWAMRWSGKSIPGRWHSTCRGPKVRPSLAYQRSIKGVWAKGRKMEEEEAELSRDLTMKGLPDHGNPSDFIPDVLGSPEGVWAVDWHDLTRCYKVLIGCWWTHKANINCRNRKKTLKYYGSNSFTKFSPAIVIYWRFWTWGLLCNEKGSLARVRAVFKT